MLKYLLRHEKFPKRRSLANNKAITSANDSRQSLKSSAIQAVNKKRDNSPSDTFKESTSCFKFTSKKTSEVKQFLSNMCSSPINKFTGPAPSANSLQQTKKPTPTRDIPSKAISKDRRPTLKELLERERLEEEISAGDTNCANLLKQTSNANELGIQSLGHLSADIDMLISDALDRSKNPGFVADPCIDIGPNCNIFKIPNTRL